MKHLLISGFVAVVLLAAAATAFRSHSSTKEASNATIGMASLKKSLDVPGKPALPDEEFEDMSVVFSAPTRHSK